MAHDGRFEKSVEVHSAWGTFEWIVEDAFRMGYRVGIVANSDGHKGRPGASYPGAGWFGAIGGLTCFLMPELTRAALLECLKAEEALCHHRWAKRTCIFRFSRHLRSSRHSFSR